MQAAVVEGKATAEKKCTLQFILQGAAFLRKSFFPACGLEADPALLT
jgi:hypothetical protein